MLRTTNIDEISEIKLIPKSINKRIKRECEIIKDTCDEIMVEYTDNEDIIVSLKKKSDRYTFNIPKNYPFTPPKLDLNGKNIFTFFNLATNRFTTVLKYISKIDCLCCNSYLCKSNWTHAITMEHIIKQIEEYKKYKYLIFIKLMLDQIKEKYLHRYIELDSWLFNVYGHGQCYYPDLIH